MRNFNRQSDLTNSFWLHDSGCSVRICVYMYRLQGALGQLDLCSLRQEFKDFVRSLCLSQFFTFGVIARSFPCVYAAILTLQISDFGMSKLLDNEEYYKSHGGKLPTKWCPPEVRQNAKHAAWCDEIGCLTLLMDATQVHPVTTENQFHCTRLYVYQVTHSRPLACLMTVSFI